MRKFVGRFVHEVLTPANLCKRRLNLNKRSSSSSIIMIITWWSGWRGVILVIVRVSPVVVGHHKVVCSIVRSCCVGSKSEDVTG